MLVSQTLQILTATTWCTTMCQTSAAFPHHPFVKDYPQAPLFLIGRNQNCSFPANARKQQREIQSWWTTSVKGSQWDEPAPTNKTWKEYENKTFQQQKWKKKMWKMSLKSLSDFNWRKLSSTQLKKWRFKNPPPFVLLQQHTTRHHSSVPNIMLITYLYIGYCALMCSNESKSQAVSHIYTTVIND